MLWSGHALVVAAISPISYVLVLHAMKAAPLSHVVPAREVSMLFAALIGGQLLGERAASHGSLARSSSRSASWRLHLVKRRIDAAECHS
jgi:hypothetical protein